jgi:hypothetical protein
MGILTFIQRKHDWTLPLAKLTDRRPDPPQRMCDFGHPVFDGNNRCSYGHRPAKERTSMRM